MGNVVELPVLRPADRVARMALPTSRGPGKARHRESCLESEMLGFHVRSRVRDQGCNR